MYHYILVDYNDKGYMYRVGVSSDTSILEILDYFKQFSRDVLYECSKTKVKAKLLKKTRKTPVGEIFETNYLFDKCLKVPKNHWSFTLRKKLLTRQTGKVFIDDEL